MLSTIALVCIAAASSASAPINDRPVIGVFYQPIDPSLQPLCSTCGNYIVGSYVQWLQASGARVALLDWNASTADLQRSFNQLSGVVLTGGHCGFHGTPYGNATRRFLDLAAAAGDFPVWGTCQGFQMLAQYSAGRDGADVLSKTGNATEGIGLTLNLTSFAHTDSKMLSTAPQSVISTLTSAPVTMNLHHYSVLKSTVDLHPKVSAFWNILATNSVEGGLEFVSLFEGKTLPFYGAQFHAEKNAYEFDQGWEEDARVDAAEVHSAPAIAAMQWFSTFFVTEARKSPHRWVQSFPGCTLSYEHQPVYTAVVATDKWENCYLN